jgi:hypothetical protein
VPSNPNITLDVAFGERLLYISPNRIWKETTMATMTENVNVRLSAKETAIIDAFRERKAKEDGLDLSKSQAVRAMIRASTVTAEANGAPASMTTETFQPAS